MKTNVITLAENLDFSMFVMSGILSMSFVNYLAYVTDLARAHGCRPVDIMAAHDYLFYLAGIENNKR